MKKTKKNFWGGGFLKSTHIEGVVFVVIFLNLNITIGVADRDMIDAFVAMGGNRDQSGNISLEFLRNTARIFQLDLHEDVLVEQDEDGNGLVDFSEFHGLLRSSVTRSYDVFQLAGGDQTESSVVRLRELVDALTCLSEVGCLTFSDDKLDELVHRIGDTTPLTLHAFTHSFWVPLGLPVDSPGEEGSEAPESVETASSVAESRVWPLFFPLTRSVIRNSNNKANV